MTESRRPVETSRIPTTISVSCSHGAATVFTLDKVQADVYLKLKRGQPRVSVDVGGENGACGACGSIDKHTLTFQSWKSVRTDIM